MSDSVHPATSSSFDAREAFVQPSDGGSKDGVGSGDHDMPFSGYRSYHFSTRELLQLLRVRGEVLDGRLGQGRFAHDVA